MTWKMEFERPITVTGPNWTIFGTLDVSGILEPECKEAQIIDHKFGRQEPLELAIALQSAAYALGLHQEITTIRRVVCHVVYPRLFREYKYTISDAGDGDTTFDTILSTIHETIIACEEWDAPLRAGHHCQYCRAIALCPAAHGNDLAVMHAPDTLPGHRIAELLDQVPIIEKKIEALRSIAKTLHWHGVEIPGYVVEERRGSRYIPSQVLAYERLKNEIPKEKFQEILDCPIKDIEDLYVKMHPELDAKRAKAQLEAVLGDAISRRPSVEVLKRKEHR